MSNPFDQFDPQTQQGANPFDQFVQPANPQIGNPQPLSFAERYIAPLLPDALGNLAGGNVRGSAVGRVAQGLADPGVAIAQMAANAVGQGQPVNQAIQQEEQQYQQARQQAGSTGFDPARLAGNIGMTGFMAAAAPAGLTSPASTTAGVIGKGALTGGGFGALQPVVGGDGYWGQKGKQVAVGAATGAATSLLGSMLARVVSPKASVNPDLKMLQAEGVQPSIGQALGGPINTAEQKAQSIPIMGDAIASMRQRARDQFNKAAINRTVAPIGETVQGTGQQAVMEAGDKLSNAYDNALKDIGYVNFDTPQFNSDLGQLQQMSTSLVPSMQDKFNKTLNDIVIGRMSPNGSMDGTTLQGVTSELKQLAGRYGKSSLASEQELGDAVMQLQSTLAGEVTRANPQAGAALQAANTGWANLVRVEGAAKAAKNHEGIFTPGQLNSAVQAADSSVRKRAVARGSALMQDLGNAGQTVLGNTYPDSGTAGRLAMGGLGLGSYFINPAIPGALIGGAAAYSKPIQNALVALVSQRPDLAPQVANYLRQLAIPASAATVPAVVQR